MLFALERSFHRTSKRSKSSLSPLAKSGGAIEIGLDGIPKAIDACTPYIKTPSELLAPTHSVDHLKPSGGTWEDRSRTSNRIPNLSFRWSIQTLPPDLRKRMANIIESRDIRDTKSSRTYVSLRYDVHVNYGNRTSESGA